MFSSPAMERQPGFWDEVPDPAGGVFALLEEGGEQGKLPANPRPEAAGDFYWPLDGKQAGPPQRKSQG